MKIFSLFEQKTISSAMEEIEMLGRQIAENEYLQRLEKEEFEARAAERQFQAFLERGRLAQEY